MLKRVTTYLLINAVIGAALAGGLSLLKAYQRDPGFRDSLIEYMETHSRRTGSVVRIQDNGEDDNEISAESGALNYSRGDWEKYIIAPQYRVVQDRINSDVYNIESRDDVSLVSYGSMVFNLKYGKSKFRKNSYQQYDQDKPVSKVIQEGFYPERELKLHVEGKVGKRLTVYIDHDSRKEDNHYKMKYQAIDDDEVIREINAGEIDIKMNDSKYAVYDDSTAKGMGMDITLRKNRLRVKAFGSVTRGQAAVENFRGNSSANSLNLREYQYIRNRYFQLEAFRRYDGLTSPPAQDATIYNRVTFTSSPADPQSYSLYAVNIDSSGFALYMDDMDGTNNYNGITISIDNGYYNRLVSGVDYTINFTTGLITFLRSIPDNARVFAVYTLNGGGTVTTDSAARTDIFSGKLCVFIKYGYSINEDINRNYDASRINSVVPDDRLNLDIYEVRSFYQIGERQILDENFTIKFYYENSLLTTSETSKTGRYGLVNTSGIVQFRLREPFRSLLGSSADAIYNERSVANKNLYSKYILRLSYFREARSFQLQHPNIIADSVRIRINGREIAKTLYTVDYTSGFLQFINATNPVITSDTAIEIRYEYLPPGVGSQAFVGGVRTDYQLNRYLNVGGTFLFYREAEGTAIPNAGSESEQIMVFEGDTKLHLGRESLKRLLNRFPGISVRSMPFSFTGYAEYARSYKNVNTFGKALIDDMESADEIVAVSLGENDWILSSPPTGSPGGVAVDQSSRGILHYFYYRHPGSAGSLLGTGFSGYPVPYSTKQGPYNVATGHVQSSIQAETSQRSLTMNFDFLTGTKDYVSVATRRLSTAAVDFSGLQYVEIWFRSAGGSGTVDLYLDVGRVSEDSDGDSRLDTEDANLNGFLDSDPTTDIYEDRGFDFNPTGGIATRIGTGPQLNSSTMGNGVLDNEDLNGNGILDTTEQFVRLPGDVTATYDGETLQGINLADTSWHRVRVYLNKESPVYLSNTNLYEDILQAVESIRLVVVRKTALQGTLYIDSIKFVSSRWRSVELDGNSVEDPDSFKVTIVDTYNDSDYRANAFIFRESGTYKSIHGERSESELFSEQESALSVEYSLAGHTHGSVTRKFSKSLDLRFYKTLNLWLYARQFSSGDTVGVVLGSSDSDYIEYRFPFEYINMWKEVTLRLQDGSSGTVEKYAVAGTPDMKRISYMKLVVYSSSSSGGKFWVNDIYVSEPETLRDDAHWYEAELRSHIPLARTRAGVPILSDIRIKYINKGHGAQFSTLGQTTKDMSEEYHELFTSANILPNWTTKFDFIYERYKTDSLNENVDNELQGSTVRKNIVFETHYVSNIYAVPSVKFIYHQVNYENNRDEVTSGYAFTRKTCSKTHSPVMLVEEKLNDIFGGDIVAKIQMDTYFKEESIRRISGSAAETELANYVTLNEVEQRQKGNARFSVYYQNKLFYINPIVDTGSHEIVRLSGKSNLTDTEVLNDVHGGYHVPFMYDSDCKFVERNKNLEFNAGMKRNSIISPSFKINMYYLENGFRDYSASEKLQSGDFQRARDTRSYISNRIDLPVNPGKITSLNFVKNVNFSYSRSLYLQEAEVPYEGEGTSSLSEDYGIRRAYGGMSSTGLNLFKYYPWYFLRGRGNYARGRDFVYSSFNENLEYQDGTVVSDYTNSYRLIDMFALSTTVDTQVFNLTYSAALNHVSERQSVHGISQQSLSVTNSVNSTFDLMQIFRFGFFRPNGPGMPHHSATMSAGYSYGINMIVTQNILENIQSPSLAFTFKKDRMSLGIRGSLEYRYRRMHEFIDPDTPEGSDDYIYATNLSTAEELREIETAYNFSILFETDVLWLHRFFSGFYNLVASPIFTIEYALLLNRYNYTVSVSPEPYDQHLITGKLTLDLHRNVQGGIMGRWAYEKFRNRDTNGIYRELVSYELSLNFTLLF